MSNRSQYDHLSLDELEEMRAELEVEMEKNPDDEKLKSEYKQLEKEIEYRWSWYSF